MSLSLALSCVSVGPCVVLLLSPFRCSVTLPLVDAVNKRITRPVRREIMRTVFRRLLSADPMAAAKPGDLAYVGGIVGPSVTPDGGSFSSDLRGKSSAPPDGGSLPDPKDAASVNRVSAKAAAKSSDGAKKPGIKKRKSHDISSDSDDSSDDSDEDTDDDDDDGDSSDDDDSKTKKKRKAKKGKLDSTNNLTKLFGIVDAEVRCCYFVLGCLSVCLCLYLVVSC